MILNYLKSYEYRLFFLVCFTVIGLVSSRAVMSIGVVAMFVNLLLDFAINPQNIKSTIPSFVKQKKLFSLSFIFFASLFALTYSSNKVSGFNFLLNKMPLLVIPLAFSQVKVMSKTAFHFLLQFYIASLVLSSFVVLYFYFQDIALVNNEIKMGKAIWVPYNHIRYNIMLVFAFISSIYLFLNIEKQKKVQKYVYIIIALYLFILLHFLSVRSGLMVLYICIVSSLIFYVFAYKKYLFGIISLFFIILVPILSYYQIESFRNKINYTVYDYEQFKNNEISGNSDSRRIVSYKIGLELISDYMPLGVGTGSLQDKMNLEYAKRFPNLKPEDRIAPHNQFMYTLIDYGVVGLLALIVSLFYPIITLQNKKKHGYYILFWLCCTVPLLIDISLEMQIGITFFALFSALLLKQITLSEANV